MVVYGLYRVHMQVSDSRTLRRKIEFSLGFPKTVNHATKRTLEYFLAHTLSQ